MRKNTQQVLNAYRHRRALRPAHAIWTDGRDIFSYGTCIATRDVRKDCTILNITKYSTTTTIHQNALRDAFDGWAHIVVDGLERGCSSVDLLQAADTLPVVSLR